MADSMSLCNKLRALLPECNIEFVTMNNLSKYECVFYNNEDYFWITDGRPATRQDCIDTIQYGKGFPDRMSFCIGFSYQDEAVAFLAIIENYPEKDTLYIGLFMMNEKFKRKSIGTKIITSLTETAFNLQYQSIKLSVQDNNISGYSFWSKLGFEVINKTDCNGFYNLSMELKHRNSKTLN